MDRPQRSNIILAAVQNSALLVSDQPLDNARAIMSFVDAIEKFDDIHELEYEQTIVIETHKLIREALDAKDIRKILPAVMTFSAMAKTGATSSMIVNLQAQYHEVLKRTNGPAALTGTDAESLVRLFADFVPKYEAEIAERKLALAPQIPGPSRSL